MPRIFAMAELRPIINKYFVFKVSDAIKYKDVNIQFDSYLVPEASLNKGQKRLLVVDRELLLPVNKSIKFLVTAKDVLHAWAVPALGLKVDAVPGRINQIEAKVNRVGVFFGQCSEICGVNHGFMPIVVRTVNEEDFISYYKQLARDL